LGATITIGLLFVINLLGQGRPAAGPNNPTNPTTKAALPEEAQTVTATPAGGVSISVDTPAAAIEAITPTPLPSHTPTVAVASPPTVTPTPSTTPSPTPTPSPTLDLAKCNAAGCGSQAIALPTVAYDTRLLLRFDPAERRLCPECPKNELLSQTELDALVKADPATLAQLRQIALSQNPYLLAPGLIYLVDDYVHHVVVDLQEPALALRNIIPPIADAESREAVRITPSYCMSPDSLVVMTADYHGLVGSNKTETGRDIFFHLGRAALFQLEGQYDIDVIRERKIFDRTTISWGGGPIFIWAGQYVFNPEQEWFTPENLEHYRNTRWAKMVAAVSEDRKYLFLSASFGISLEEHAQNVINLGQKWGIPIDRAMRFDGSESAYLAIRLRDYMVPVLSLEEPLIVNCLAVEQKGQGS